VPSLGNSTRTYLAGIHSLVRGIHLKENGLRDIHCSNPECKISKLEFRTSRVPNSSSGVSTLKTTCSPDQSPIDQNRISGCRGRSGMDIRKCNFLQTIAGTRIWIYGAGILVKFTCRFIRHIFLQSDFREIKFFKAVDIRHTNTGYLLADLFTSLATLVHLDIPREEKGSLSNARLQHGPPMNSVLTRNFRSHGNFG
jgi:hypothetical protein